MNPGTTRKKDCIGEKSVAHEIVEAVGADGSPGAGDLDDEIAVWWFQT